MPTDRLTRRHRSKRGLDLGLQGHAHLGQGGELGIAHGIANDLLDLWSHPRQQGFSPGGFFVQGCGSVDVRRLAITGMEVMIGYRPSITRGAVPEPVKNGIHRLQRRQAIRCCTQGYGSGFAQIEEWRPVDQRAPARTANPITGRTTQRIAAGRRPAVWINHLREGGNAPADARVGRLG